MSDCQLTYIPERLHNSDRKPLINRFHIDDILYRRAPEKLIQNPYASVSLTDLSHNIGIVNEEEISKRKDVLFSILEEEDFEMYAQQVISLRIISLNEESQYDKVFTDPKREDVSARIRLAHRPVTCMYPHGVFRFFVKGKDTLDREVTFDNYKQTLGKKKFKRVRALLRQELARMIIRKKISYKD